MTYGCDIGLSTPRPIRLSRRSARELVVAGRRRRLDAAGVELAARPDRARSAGRFRWSGHATQAGAVLFGTPRSSALIAELAAAARARRAGRVRHPQRQRQRQGRRRSSPRTPMSACCTARSTSCGWSRRASSSAALDIVSQPRTQIRVLNHWDNLDRHVERGYAGQSIWDWHKLPAYLDPRYTDYARACASLGINGAVLTNVNANATSLTPPYLDKAAALAGVLRPYGIRVYLTARFSAPIELGGLKTADPLDPRVRAWWKAKVDEIYARYPGLRRLPRQGELGRAARTAGLQAHPRRRREHARRSAGAAWRRRDLARVRLLERNARRSRQAGLQRVRAARRQVRRQRAGAGEERRHRFPAARAVPSAVRRDAEDAADDGIPDHQGISRASPRTSPISRRCSKKRSTRTRWSRAKARRSRRSSTANCTATRRPAWQASSNIGADRNWTGSHFDQANWYAFGRLAWDPDLSAQRIAQEWVRMTFQQRRGVRDAGGRDDDGLARSGGGLHDAARAASPLGHRPSLWPGAVGRQSQSRATGIRLTTIAPTPTASASIAAPRAATPTRNTRRRSPRMFADSAQDARAVPAVVPPRAVGLQDLLGAHPVGRAGRIATRAASR